MQEVQGEIWAASGGSGRPHETSWALLWSINRRVESGLGAKVEAERPGRGYCSDIVTESKLVLLTTQQADKLRDELLGQGIVTLLRKPADREAGGLLSQRTILPKSEFKLLLY